MSICCMDLGDSCCLAQLHWRRPCFERVQVDIINHQQVELLQDVLSIRFGSTFERSLYVKEVYSAKADNISCAEVSYFVAIQGNQHFMFTSNLHFGWHGSLLGSWNIRLQMFSYFGTGNMPPHSHMPLTLHLDTLHFSSSVFAFGSRRCYAEACAG